MKRKKALKRIVTGAVVTSMTVLPVASLNALAYTDNGNSYEWKNEDGKAFWYENGERQGIYGSKGNVFYDDTERGREIYDRDSDAWYWLDAVYNGAKAVDKEVFMPYIYSDEENHLSDEEWIKSVAALSKKTKFDAKKNGGEAVDLSAQIEQAIKNHGKAGAGKWVRYDSKGRMVKGWYKVQGRDAEIYKNQVGNVYYYDRQTGLMAKGNVKIDGIDYTFDEVSGVLTSGNAPFIKNNDSTENMYTVRTDADGNPIDLGGMQIILKDWWSDPKAEPSNEYEQAKADYRDWAMETYNFEMIQSGDYGWGNCLDEVIEYASKPATDEYVLYTVRSDPKLGEIFKKGYVYDLSTLDCLDFSNTKYAQNDITTLCTYKGKIYGMSAGVSEPRDGFFFNENLLAEGGFTPDDIYDLQKNGEWTWDKFEEICKAVRKDKDNDGNYDVWAWSGNTGSFTTDIIFSNGGSIVGIGANGYTYEVENPKTVAALEKANELIKEYRMKDPQVKNSETGEMEYATWDYFYKAFKNGDCVFMYDGAYAGYANGQIGDITDFPVGFVMMPKGPDGELVNQRSNNPVVIPSNYDKDTAWKIAFAYDIWTEEPAGFEGYNGYVSNCYSGIYDERACNETIPLMASVGHGFVNYAPLIPELDVSNGFIWSVNGEASIPEIIDFKRDYFMECIDNANK